MVCTELTVTQPNPPVSIIINEYGFARDRQAPIPNEYITPCNVPYDDVKDFNEAVIIDFDFSSRLFVSKKLKFTATFRRPDGTTATLTGEETFYGPDIVDGERVMLTNSTKYVVGRYSNLNVTVVEV